jgi:tetratricopeptide (TPR) repeat protein
VAESSILTGLLAGYFFHNLTVFDNVTSYILFGSTLAYIAWRVGEVQQRARLFEKISFPEKFAAFTAVGAVPVVWAAVWLLNIPAINQNKLLIQAISPKPDISMNLDYFKQATAIGSLGTQEVREQLAQGAAQIASSNNVSTETKQKFFQLAIFEMTEQAKMSPLDARFPLFLGLVFGAYGDVANAKVALQRAHELSPAKQSIIVEQAANAQAAGDTEGSLAFLKQAYDVLPANMQVRLFYAAALITNKQDTLAEEILKPALESGDAADARIAAAYANRGRYDKIAEIWEKRIAANETDFKAYFTLAAAYYASQNSAKAIQILETLKAKSPANVGQADSLIQQIRDGTAKVK